MAADTFSATVNDADWNFGFGKKHLNCDFLRQKDFFEQQELKHPSIGEIT